MNKTNMAAPSMGFTPEDMKSISSVLGYTGEPSGFANYLSQNPQAHDSFMGIQQQRTQFNNGGFVATQNMANGGGVQNTGLRIDGDPVLDEFLNSGYIGGTPFFDGRTGQYIPSLTLSDGRTITREQFDSMQQRGNEPLDFYGGQYKEQGFGYMPERFRKPIDPVAYGGDLTDPARGARNAAADAARRQSERDALPYAGDRAYGRNPYGNQAIGGPGIRQKQEDYIKQNIDPNTGYFQMPYTFGMPGPNAPPPDPDLNYDNLLPTLEARGLINKTGPFLREGDYDQFGNPTEYTYEQSKQLNFRNEQQKSMPGTRQVYNTGNTSQQLPQQQQSQFHVMTNPDGSAMNEEDMARYDSRIANIITPIGQQGPSPLPTQQAPPTTGQVDLSNVNAPQIGAETAQRLQQPTLPAGGVYTANQTPTEAAQSVAPSTALITEDVRVAEAGTAQAAQAIGPTESTAAAITAAQAAPDVRDVATAAAAQQAAPTQVTAAQQAGTAVSQLQGAQTAGTQVQAPTARQLGAGEVIAAPTGQAAQAAAFVQPTAAVATPSSQATVQGQLASLVSQFTDTEVPLWARGAVDNARAVLQQRGIGASSMAGQAIVEAAMRAALPIAQVDAATVAGFEQANLSNRQQAAMVSAQYRAQFMQQEFDTGFQTRVQNAARVADIANLNFNSGQQIALENARLAQTADLSNLSNKQALVMANAAQVAGLETTNLNNRQQSAVQNAQNFLQVDMANLGNSQQTALFNAQNRTQSILSDVAAENAARQFNAANEQQLDQFFANLGSQVSQQNSAQQNAINQFNAGEINTLQRFNSEIVNQRDQFNAQNQLAIAQSNAQWRRNLATTDTAAVNFQNQLNAQNLLDISNTAYSNLWQEYRDVMEWSWSSGENESERLAAMTVAQLNAKSRTDLAEYNANRENTKAVGGFVGDIFSGVLKAGASSVFKSIPLIGGLF